MAKLLGVSKNGIEVFEHPQGHNHLSRRLLAEAIGMVELEGAFFKATFDMGRVIGKDHLIELDDDTRELVYYARRGDRPNLSKMVLVNAPETSLATLIACVEDEDPELKGKWVVATFHDGRIAPREPKSQDDPLVKEWENIALSPTDEEIDEIDTSSFNEWMIRNLAFMLVEQEEFEFGKYVQVKYAVDSDIISSYKYPVSYPDGRKEYDNKWTVSRIQERIERHSDGYDRNPEGYDW